MKKLGILFFTVIILTITGTLASFADPAEVSAKKVEEVQKSFEIDKSFVNKPKDFALNTINDTVVISGDGKENDKITIVLYKKDGDSYKQMGEAVELTIGPLGVFTKEISLKDQQNSPKEAAVSKETFVVLELKRGANAAYDYRLIKFSDEKEVKETLKSVKAASLTAPVAKN